MEGNVEVNEASLFGKHDFVQIHKYVDTWKDLQFEDVQVNRIAYGMGSYVFQVTIVKEEHTHQPRSLIYRKFFQTKAQEKIQLENKVFNAMSKLKIGPKSYEANNEFRIEEFIESRVIQSKEINEEDIRRKLALKLGIFHQVELEDFDKTKDFLSLFLEKEAVINTVKEHCGEKEKYNEEELKVLEEISKLISEDEMNFMRGEIKKQPYPLILSHNDIWVGNILIDEKTRDLLLIDYEFVCYNFPGYDIAKTLLEPMYKRRDGSPEYDLTVELMPNESEILDFIRFYLISTKWETLEENILALKFNEESLKQVESQIFKSEEEKTQLMTDLLKNVYFGMMVCGYYMAVVGMTVGRNELMPMDFAKFSIDGFGIYRKYKQLIYGTD